MSGELAEEAGGLQGAADNLEEGNGGKEQSQELQRKSDLLISFSFYLIQPFLPSVTH